MSSFLKNQILKYLTKFTKNLSPEKIKINAFKGEGDVTNLELDEGKIAELLELPKWLRIKRAACNKVSIKVPWTQIKKQSILLVFDDVLVSVEALEILKMQEMNSNTSYRVNQGGYGFIDRVIDGMQIKINLVRIIFTASAFKATIELTRLVVTSKMPNWSDADHLKKTRIRSTSQGILLLFKEIEWDSTRIEANGLQDVQATPLKLITNTTKIRLTLKKNMNDCSIIESKVEFILKDLFWVLTISQIKAAIIFIESLKGIIQKSNEMNQEAAKIRIQLHRASNSGQSSTGKTINSIFTNPSMWTSGNNINSRQKLFLKYNLVETSYHIFVSRVEFHFCEEGDQGTSLSKNAVINGSVKLLLINCQVDLYPYHVAAMTRTHFSNYKDVDRMRDLWMNGVFPQSSSSNEDEYNRLMESVIIFRFNDISMNCVSTAQKTNNNLFLGSDIMRHKLPNKTTTFFLDLTDHYWKTGSFQNLPETVVFCQINPINLNLDWPTVLWLNAFMLNLTKELMSHETASGFLAAKEVVNCQSKPAIHIEAIMPRVTLVPEILVTDQPDRPNQLQIQVGNLSIDNMRQVHSEAEQIHQVIQEYQQSSFFNGFVHFPSCNADSKMDYKMFYANGYIANKSIWQINFDPLWIDYDGAKSYEKRPKSFLESVNVALWISLPFEASHDIGIICKLRDSLEIKIDHYQLLLINRIVDSVSSATNLLQQDNISCNSSKDDVMSAINMQLYIKKVCLKFEWPSTTKVYNETSDCSTSLQLPVNETFDEHISESSDSIQKPDEPFIVMDQSHFNIKYQKSFSRQPSPVRALIDNAERISVISSSAGLQANRRSYTSLTSAVQSQNVSNTPSSSSNLITYKSVKSLFSSAKGSHKGSQSSLNTSDLDGTSADSDTSDWISEGMLNDIDIGEDILNESLAGISFIADEVAGSTNHVPLPPCSATVQMSNFKMILGMKESTFISFGVFGKITIVESEKPPSDTTSAENNFKRMELSNESTPSLLGRIGPNKDNPSQLSIDVHVTDPLQLSMLMSSISNISELFEDEIPPSEKYPDTVLPPIILLKLLYPVDLNLIEDRKCNSLSCPNEHAPLLLKLPAQMTIKIEGVTIISFGLDKIDTECTNGPTSYQKNEKHNISRSNSRKKNNRSSSIQSINSHNNDALPTNTSNQKEGNSNHMNMILQLQRSNRKYQDEIIKLKLELEKVKKERKALLNLIESPSTNLI